MGSSLSALFRRNPYRDRMQTTAGMIDRSGLARPFLMGELGDQTRRAEEYDAQTSSTLEEMYRDEVERGNEKALMEDADKVIKAASDLAKQDPVAATQYYNDRAKRNKHLPQGLTFRRSVDGKSLMEVKDEKGQVRGIINSTDMFMEAQEIEKRTGKPLEEKERTELAQKYFYPVPGYKEPSGEKKDLFQSWKETFRKEHGRDPNLKEIEEYHRNPNSGGEGSGRVKSGDTKALKIELSRKMAPKAIKLLEEKYKDLPEGIQKIKKLKAALSNVDPLTKDLNPDAVYNALAAADEELAREYDEAILDAEDIYSRTGRVAGAVNDAMTRWHKKQKAKNPPKPKSGGKDWRKYLGR